MAAPGSSSLRRALLIIVAIVVVVPTLIVAFPRTDAAVRVWYAEGPMNQITVDYKVKNRAIMPLDAVDINVTILTVRDGADTAIGETSHVAAHVGPYAEEKADSFVFTGDALAQYSVLVDISFTSFGRLHQEQFTFHVQDGIMNQVWERAVAG